MPQRGVESQWYLSELVMEITVSGARRNVVHRNLVLIRADSPEQAYKKAIELGQKAESSYDNPKGQQVKHTFRGVAKLEEMYEDPEDGAELTFEEYVGISSEEIGKWIPAKEKLQVFVPPRPGSEHDPDYRSRKVMAVAGDMLSRRDRLNRR